MSPFNNINFASSVISDISLTDALDIFIVAYFVYKISSWVKDTRARPLFKGIIIVMIISILSFIFNLVLLSWLVRTTFSVGVMALVILFQPELRKALEKIGKGKFSLPINLSYEQADEEAYKILIDQILKALKILSSTRTGALILLEKQMSLQDLEYTGTRVDAIVSDSLIINLFEDKTPLHDGAVIIRNGRISSASCILPLTQKQIGKEYGTRHRAAVSSSEIYDAYAIVVSEETGYVNVAYDGNLLLNLSQDQLRRLLMGEDKATKKKFVLWR